MITCIDSYYNNTPSLYENMSLDDACMSMILEVNQAIHDFNMDIILDEHVYLYETGTEVDYINEAIGYNLITKAYDLIDKVKNLISRLFDKLIDWITDKIEDFKRTITSIIAKTQYKHILKQISVKNYNFIPAGFNIAVKNEAYNAWLINIDEDAIDCIYTDYGFIDNIIEEKTYYKPNEFFNKFIEEHSDSKLDIIKFDTEDIQYIFNEAYIENNSARSSSVIKDIKKLKNDINKKLEHMKKGVNAFKSTEDSKNVIQTIQLALNSNTYVCRDKIKLTSLRTNAFFKVATLILKTQIIPKINKAEEGEPAEDVSI